MHGTHGARGCRGDAAAALAVSVLFALAAALVLRAFPAGNDQALFVYYARRILEGAIPYSELWDNKQPGIFAFYLLPQWLGGEGWPAVRLAYAAWLGAGAGVLAWIGRIAAPGTPAWLIAPVLGVGLTLIRTTTGRPAQVESLVGLPLAAMLLLALPDAASRAIDRLRWLTIGALVAVVASLKLVLAPVAASIVAAALGWRLLRGAMRPAQAIPASALTVAGFAAILLPILAWIHAAGAWTEFRWTMLDYPRLALAQVPSERPQKILWAFRWLAITVGALLPAAALLVARASRAPRSADALVAAACLGWLVSGTVMFLTQRFSWWETHMDMLVWPVALMAAFGLARVPPNSARGPGLRRAAALLALAGIAVLLAKAVSDRRHPEEWPIPAAFRDAAAIARDVAARHGGPCGTVYAIGDQAAVERQTGLRQALPTHGLWFGAFLPAQARRLPDELAAARPDLVYFDAAERADFERLHPQAKAGIDAWLRDEYVAVATDPIGGTWHVRRPEVTMGTTANCPAAGRFRIPDAAP